MISIKNLFLFLLMFNTINVFTIDVYTMNPTTKIVEKICCKIDTDLLGINKYHCFRSFSSAILSYYNTIFLSPTTADQQIQKIASYLPSEIPSDEKKKIFVQLLKQHWYVHYLIHILINKKIKEFENVKGSTIDLLLNPNFTDDANGIKKIIHHKALKSFVYHANINYPIEHMPCTRYLDIQFICLWHDTEIDQSSLIMSHSSPLGHYLKAQDICGKTILWNINRGAKTNISPDPLQWAHGDILGYMYPGVKDINDNYTAFVTGAPYARIYELPIDDALETISGKLSNTILLLKRPTQETYICRVAFSNSRNNQKELTILQKSAALRNIDGFPKENLLAKIKKQLREISKPQ